MTDEETTTLAALLAEMRAGFARVDERFEKIDERFGKLDDRFEFLTTEMQAGFARVYERFDEVSEAHGKLFAAVGSLESRFIQAEQKLTRLELAVHHFEQGAGRVELRAIQVEGLLRSLTTSVKSALDKLRDDAAKGRAEDLARYTALDRRLEALEKALGERH